MSSELGHHSLSHLCSLGRDAAKTLMSPASIRIVAVLAIITSALLLTHAIKHTRRLLLQSPKDKSATLSRWAVSELKKHLSHRDHDASPASYDCEKGQLLKDYYDEKTAFVADGLSSRGRRSPSEAADAEEERVRYLQQDFIRSLVWANHDMVCKKPSELEGPQQPAIYFRESESAALPEGLRATNGEHVHVHPDGSSHMILSAADAATAVAQGWGELQKLGGGGLVGEFVAVYAPRDEGELKAWKELVLASVRFCDAGHGREIRRPE